jgi:arsenate reductase
MTIQIYHNPDCGTSRNVLALIKAAGYEPDVIDYIKVGWTKPLLIKLFQACNLTPREALRLTKSPAKDLGLDDPAIKDEQVVDMMILHPVLVNRPIVCSPKGTKLCRPSETVLTLLERLPQGPFFKEDGSLLIDANGTVVS